MHPSTNRFDRVSLAARNNALWCCEVCHAHGVHSELTDNLWICHGQPPRFHSSATTLRPKVQASIRAAVLPCGFKDGFCDIDGAALGYRELFHAQWLWLDQPKPGPTTLAWRRIETDEALLAWERRWALGDAGALCHPRQFPPALIQNPSHAFMAGFQADVLMAGCILNLTAPVVGVSNTFGAAWDDYGQVAARIFPGHPAVGYERDGPSLGLARSAGFEVVAPLRVWIPR